MESIDFGDITKPVGFTVTLNYQNDGKVAFFQNVYGRS